MVDRRLCDSREKAQRAILAGSVRLNGQRVHKSSEKVKPGDLLTLTEPERFVSRGGWKLDRALESFGIEVAGRVAVDIGSSTGGFTDCLLQRGATRVYAVDVGKGQLAWKLRQDPRVVVLEGVNARYLTRTDFPPPFEGVDLAVIDCSFISLRHLIPPAAALLAPGRQIVALIKPQFEAGKSAVDRGAGVITDPEIHRTVLEGLQQFVGGQHELKWSDVIESPILGAEGNKEYLVLLEKRP